MRAKHIAWVVAVLLSGVVVVLVARQAPSVRSTSKELAEVISGIEKLKSDPDIEFTGSQQYDWEASIVGGKFDKLRDLLGLQKPKYPLEVFVLSFRDSKGRFLLQYITSRDGLFRLEVFTDARFEDPSLATMDLVRKCLPTARVSKVNFPNGWCD